MQERIVGAALGGVRLVLVVAALAVALLPIGRSALTGFCPPAGGAEDATAGQVVLAAARPAGSASATVLADVDAPVTDVPATDVPATDVPATDVPATDAPATDAPATDDPDAPATEDPEAGTTGEDQGVAACAGGVDRCLPPLVSAVISFGSGPCGEEAIDQLRGSMLPAFGVATALLAGAWALRPRDGRPVLSRW